MDEFDLKDCEFMEIELNGQDLLPNSDPNLNVTSAPEQLDFFYPNSPFAEATTTAIYNQEETSTLIELTKVMDPSPMLITSPSTTYMYAQDYDGGFSTDKCPGPPLLTTVTLVKPLMGLVNHDQETTELLQELYQDADGESVSVSSSGSDLTCSLKRSVTRLHRSPADDDASDETQTLEYDEQVPSPSDSLETGFTYGSEDPSHSSSSVVGVPADRETDIERKAAYIRQVIEKRSNKPDDMSSKLKVHEVILVILLNSAHGDRTKDLQRILTFCDENGKETSGPGECRHFKTLDTETMGLLWQKIKGNKKGNYDTFARAMRVRRERSEGFFDYLESGKGKKKRIYRFGDRSMEEMSRFKRTLKQMSRPQACSY